MKIPDFTALGERNPRASGAIPNFPGSDPRATALQGLGDTMAKAGNSVLAGIQEQNRGIDVNLAEANWTKGNLALQNEFETDGDYATYGSRVPARTDALLKQSAALIRDPKMRERWLAGSQAQAAKVNDTIFDRGNTLRHQAGVLASDSARETFRRIYVDPNTDEAAKAKARAEIEGSIHTDLATGLLTPDEADARKKLYLDKADKSRAELWAEQHPETFIKGGGPVAGMIADTAKKYGVSPEIPVAIAKIESGLDPNAKAGTSSAGGLFQFVTGTAKQYGLTDKFDAAANADAGVRLTRDNIEGLRKDLGREPTPGEIYIAHFGGYGVAEKLGKASADTPVSQIFSPQAIAANRSILAGKTAGEVRAWADQKMAAAIKDTGGTATAPADEPDYFKRLSPEDQSDVRRFAEQEQRRQAVDTKGAIEVATQNAPIAIQNTGTYSGHIPSIDEFTAAYGGLEGAQRHAAFQAAMDVGQQAHDFQTMPAAEIQQAVQAATPTSSGEDAALEQKRYDALSNAADATIKARRADPSGYVQQAFPNVAQAWQDAEQSKDYQPALAATAAAQRQLGMDGLTLLPASVATDAADTFKAVDKPEADRLSAATGLVFSTSDPAQRKAVFDQLVKAGLPEVSEGAFQAMERGDTGAARRLFQAAMVDPSNLPGQSPYKPGEIGEAIQSSVMDKGQVGDVYYGLTGGATDNFVKAERDSKLMSNAVNLRVRAGEDLESAVAGAAKDLFGDVKTVNETNAQILLPSDADPQPVLDGLTSVMPLVRSTMEQNMAVPSVANGSGDKAVFNAVTSNYVDRVMAEGYFRNSGNGFVFIDPFVGAAVADANGRPVIFTEKDFAKPVMPVKRQPANSDGPLTDDAFVEFQKRMLAPK